MPSVLPSATHFLQNIRAQCEKNIHADRLEKASTLSLLVTLINKLALAVLAVSAIYWLALWVFSMPISPVVGLIVKRSAITFFVSALLYGCVQPNLSSNLGSFSLKKAVECNRFLR